MAHRTRLLLIFGGQSAEHEVSCTTAAHVLAAVDTDRFEPVPIGVTTDGKWLLDDHARRLASPAQRSGASAIEPLSAQGSPTSLASVMGDGPAVAFPLIHGPMGEDGTIQGMLELAGLPYVGCGVLGSALAMDKAAAKEILAYNGIPQCRWLTINLGIDSIPEAVARVADELGYPCFVKPANMGSSVGVTRAVEESSLQAAIELAGRYDETVVVEEAVNGREIELAVLGNHELDVSVPGEIVPGDEFYSYDDKYVDGAAELRIPAEVDPATTAELQDLARRSFRALRAEGMGRADFFLTDDGPLFNELNTIPGFTPISMYPKLWAASGVPYTELISRLVDLAIERYQRRSAHRTTDRGQA